MSLTVRLEDFKLLSGEPKFYTRGSDSGRTVKCAFCAECGVRVYHEPERMAGLAVNIKPGTLDDTSWLQPMAHAWIGRRLPWVEIPASCAQFDTQP
jgi:hypothetical protein